jgi:signal transduction histidine kinase
LTQTLKSTASQFNKLRLLVVWILVIELLLGVLIGMFLASKLASPIKNVSSEVYDIANNERFDPIPEQGPVEIKELATSVNLLASRLKELEETRRRLLANLVHEIGRPLGAILAAIHVMRREPGEDPLIRHELLEGIEKEINRMQPMLDDLAQLHGQVLGTFEVHRSPTNLKEWLPTILVPWEAAAHQKELQWSVHLPEDLPEIHIDKDRIAQALGNLLSNAIKFTPPGGLVRITAGKEPGMIWIEVMDDGPGIFLDEKDLVFEPFYRSETSHRFPQGLGLGLTIAREIINAHGGTLELESTPGSGSRFKFNIPTI